MGYMWTLVEMELSLMYDILYTKAPVLHTLAGYCIRVVSSLAVVASFLLFLFYGREGNRSTDVTITYVLLGSAFLIEMTLLLSALWSTWTFSFLCATRWSGLLGMLLCVWRGGTNFVVWSFLFDGLPTAQELLASSGYQGGGQAPWGSTTCWRCAQQGMEGWQGSWAIACLLLVFQMASVTNLGELRR